MRTGLQWLVVVAVCSVSDGGLQEKHEKTVMETAQWDTAVVLCDTQDCPHGSTYLHVNVNITDTLLLVAMFESVSKLSAMNWLVYCNDCMPILRVINEYETSHQLQGYFTHLYQWIIVTDFNATKSQLEEKACGITNLAIFDHSGEVYTCMFGENGTRYFDYISSEELAKNATIFPNLRHGMNAMQLRLCVMEWAPFVIRQQDGGYTGYYLKLLRIIAKELNFTFTVYESPDRQYGLQDRNGEWNGMIKELITKQADLAGVLSYSAERAAVVDQPTQAVDVDHGLVIYHTEPPMLMSISFVVRPFSEFVWLCFLGTMCLASAAFLCAQRFGKTACVSASSVFENCSYIFRSTLNQGSPIEPRNPSSRIIYSIYAMGLIIVMALYTGHLVALLSVRKLDIPFRTMLEVAENSEYKLGILGGTLSYSLFMHGNFSSGNTLGKLQAKMRRDAERDARVISEDYADHVAMLQGEKYAFYSTRSDYDAIASTTCSVSPLEQRSYLVLNGLLWQKNSVFTRYFDNVLRRIHEGHLDRNIKKEFWPKPMQCVHGYDPTVRISNLPGIFYILLGGVACACISLIMEHLVHRCCARSQTASLDLQTPEPEPQTIEL